MNGEPKRLMPNVFTDLGEGEGEGVLSGKGWVGKGRRGGGKKGRGE